MSAYVPRGQGGTVVIGGVFADLGSDKGTASADVEVTRQGGIVLKNGAYSERLAVFSVDRAKDVIELLQKGIEVSSEINRLFADLKAQEAAGLERIVSTIKEFNE